MKHQMWRSKRTGYLATGTALVLASTALLAGQQLSKTQVTDEAGISVTYTSQDRLGTTRDGFKYAPRPEAEFRNEQCGLRPQAPQGKPQAQHLSLPDVETQIPVRAGADLINLPAAPETLWYEDSAPIGAAEGKSIIAGHVDHPDGELSPFGQLHKAQPCDHVYAPTGTGQMTEFVITDMYTVPQDQIDKTGIFSTSGDPELVMVTCSGPSVGKIGQEIGFSYSHNLVVEAAPVEVAT